MFNFVFLIKNDAFVNSDVRPVVKWRFRSSRSWSSRSRSSRSRSANWMMTLDVLSSSALNEILNSKFCAPPRPPPQLPPVHYEMMLFYKKTTGSVFVFTQWKIKPSVSHGVSIVSISQWKPDNTKPLAVLLDPNKTHKMRRLKSNYNWRSPRGAFMDLVLNVKYQLIVNSG